MKKNQKGIGLLNIFIALLITGFIVVFGLQIGIGYMNRNIISKTVASVLIENKNNEASITSIKKSIIDRVKINNITLEPDDITITENNSKYTIQVSYMKTIDINSDISILMDFLIEESTP